MGKTAPMDLQAMARGSMRTFALTLRLLPAAMRDEVTLACLLARATDTVADTPGIDAADRLALLAAMDQAIQGTGECGEWRGLPAAAGTRGEQALVAAFPRLAACLARADPGVRGRVRQVVGTIVSGQTLDIRRFEAEGVHALATEAALTDYLWRVAGCVGKFWTEVTAARCPQALRRPVEQMAAFGIRYGKGLQLLNILRDAPEDWRRGRCYLPWRGAAAEVGGAIPATLFELMRSWLPKCREWLEDGHRYAEAVRGRRLRTATVLPARIGVETLAALDQAGREAWLGRVKLPRRRVRWLVVKSLLGR